MDFRLNDEGKRGLFFAWLPLQGTWIKRKTNVSKTTRTKVVL